MDPLKEAPWACDAVASAVTALERDTVCSAEVDSVAVVLLEAEGEREARSVAPKDAPADELADPDAL